MAADVSQRVVRYEGEGKTRRPVYLDEGPASATVARQLGEGKTGLLDGLPQRELGGAGAIERTYLSEAERTERVVAKPLGPTNAERMQASRQRGAERHVEVVAAAKPVAFDLTRPQHPPFAPSPAIEEEPAMEPRTHIPKTIPEHSLVVLAEMVATAITRRVELDEAENERYRAIGAWEEARAALDAAYRALDEPPTAVEPEEDPDHEAAKVGIIRALREADAASKAAKAEPDRSPIGGGPARSRSGEGQRAGQASARDRRAASVMSAMSRLDDDMGAVAAELGMKKNAVSQIVKFARKRAGAEA